MTLFRIGLNPVLVIIMLIALLNVDSVKAIEKNHHKTALVNSRVIPNSSLSKEEITRKKEKIGVLNKIGKEYEIGGVNEKEIVGKAKGEKKKTKITKEMRDRVSAVTLEKNPSHPSHENSGVIKRISHTPLKNRRNATAGVKLKKTEGFVESLMLFGVEESNIKDFYKSKSYITKLGILIHYNLFIQIYIVLFLLLTAAVIIYTIINNDMKNNITELLKSAKSEEEIKKMKEEEKKKEKENVDLIKSKYIPDSRPIYITITDHKVEDFINALEKAVF